MVTIYSERKAISIELQRARPFVNHSLLLWGLDALGQRIRGVCLGCIYSNQFLNFNAITTERHPSN